MTGNSSSSFHHGFLNMYCFITRPGSFIITTFLLTSILLLLPLCIFILHHGLQLWRQKKRSTSSAATASHSDCFTYNMVAMELISVCGCVLFLCGVHIKDRTTLLAGFYLFTFTWYGENFFHVLTCVERYLAVVHPITYLSLRNQRGIRIRNISIAGVWMFCFAVMGLIMVENYIVVDFFSVIFSLIVTSFCSVSVVRVLVRPGPGEQGGGRERVDQSKQRAFYTIMVILGVLVLRFVGGIFWALQHVSGTSVECLRVTAAFWFNLPTTLVLPLLFLHRAGKFVCWRKNIQ